MVNAGGSEDRPLFLSNFFVFFIFCVVGIFTFAPAFGVLWDLGLLFWGYGGGFFVDLGFVGGVDNFLGRCWC